MSPCDILLGYRGHWWPAIKHMDSTLHLSQNKIKKTFSDSSENILLPRIKVNRHFPCALIPIALAFGGLVLKNWSYNKDLNKSHT